MPGQDDSQKSKPQTARAIIESKIHQAYTVACDELLMRGYIDRDTRLAIGGLLGGLLTQFGDQLPPALQTAVVEPGDLDVIAAKAMPDDSLVWFGSAAKALGDGRVGGYLVRFSGPNDPDLTGDFFTPDTDFGDRTETDVLYQHGLDRKIGNRPIGRGTLRRDEVGVWVESQLALRNEYEKMIYALAEQGKLGWSSATLPARVARQRVGKAYHITRWPLGLDASLTPIPAEPRTAAVALKSLLVQRSQETRAGSLDLGTDQAPPPDGGAAPEPDGSQANPDRGAQLDPDDMALAHMIKRHAGIA